MQRVIGLVGGLSPYSTILYYKFLVEYYREREGVDPRVIIYSIPVQEMCDAVKKGDQVGARSMLAEALEGLGKAGAGLVLLAANTPHIFIDEDLLKHAGGARFIDIREAVAWKLERLGVERVGLLATKQTLESRLYHDYLENKGYEVITPSRHGNEKLQEVIEKLTQGVIPDSSKLILATLISELTGKGAEAIIYGCTELSLLIGRVRVNKPIVDSLTEHVRYAIDKALGLGEGD